MVFDAADEPANGEAKTAFAATSARTLHSRMGRPMRGRRICLSQENLLISSLPPYAVRTPGEKNSNAECGVLGRVSSMALPRRHTLTPNQLYVNEHVRRQDAPRGCIVSVTCRGRPAKGESYEKMR